MPSSTERNPAVSNTGNSIFKKATEETAKYFDCETGFFVSASQVGVAFAIAEEESSILRTFAIVVVRARVEKRHASSSARLPFSSGFTDNRETFLRPNCFSPTQNIRWLLLYFTTVTYIHSYKHTHLSTDRRYSSTFLIGCPS